MLFKKEVFAMFGGFTVMFALGMIVVLIFGIASIANFGIASIANDGKEKGR